jgi:hypothetical protein
MAPCLIDVETRAVSPRARSLTTAGTSTSRPRSQMASIVLCANITPPICSPFPSNRRLTPFLTSSTMTEDRFQLIPQRRYREVEDEDAALRLAPRKKPHVFLASGHSSWIDSLFAFSAASPTLWCTTDAILVGPNMRYAAYTG